MSSIEKKGYRGRGRGAGRKTLAVAASVILAVTATLPAAMQEANALDNELALTPPMGWNSWNQTRCYDLNENVVKATADAMASNGMKEAGYEYVVVDDCYQGERDPETGKLTANPERFPGGMKALGDYIHSKGLKFGIYGVPGTRTCANDWDNYPITGNGSFGKEALDARTWAEWGVDYLKYDWCAAGQNAGVEKIPAFNKMRDELKKLDRDIVYAISEYGDNNPWEWGAETANLWRTTHDINSNWNSVSGIIDGQANLWQYAKPGAWNDPDMLQVGNGGFATDWDANRSHIGMWAMLAAPMFVGTSVPALKPQILDALTNPDLIAIDQDPLGKQAKRLVNNADGSQVWARPLQGNKVAVALYNKSGSATTISTTVGAVGGTGMQTVRSVWDKKNVMNTAGALSASVPARGTVIYILTPGADPSLQTPPELQGSVSIPAGATKDATFTVSNADAAEMTDVKVTFGTATGVTLPSGAQTVGTIAGKSSKEFTVSVTAAANAQGSITVPATITYGTDKSVTTSIVIKVPLAAKAHISDLTWLTSSNGYGPVERDKANGELAANDGPSLKLAGVTYPKGLGTNPAARVSVALDGQCTTFKAVIGMDDDVKDRAAAGGVMPKSTFEVYGDGTEKFNFSFEQPRDEPREITVDVTGVKTLELRNELVGTDEKRSWFAWSDWADAHLICGATEPTATPTATASTTPTSSATATATATTTETVTATTTATAAATATVTATATTTATATATTTATATSTATATKTVTVQPTTAPSVKPTSKPSVKPTTMPSVKPTSGPTPKPVDGITLYTTPGFHDVNGRTWHTTCEPYSQTIRCTTDIWSTQVELKGGRYVKDTGWHFNNLTYLPKMTRAQWGSNPLANNGTFTSAGRQWRTECDTAATGSNACRSYIWSTQVFATQKANGTWTYAMGQDWVFNNIVKFS